MTNTQAKEVFNAAAQTAIDSGNHDQASRIELAREFFTNAAFRKALENHVWELNQAAGR
jgi:hypothetical protein